MALSPKKNYFSDRVIKQPLQEIHLHQMRDLDEQLEILRKELNNLELIEAITESTSQLVFSMEDMDDTGNETVLNKKENIDLEFYRTIEEDLRKASANLKSALI